MDDYSSIDSNKEHFIIVFCYTFIFSFIKITQVIAMC